MRIGLSLAIVLAIAALALLPLSCNEKPAGGKPSPGTPAAKPATPKPADTDAHAAVTSSAPAAKPSGSMVDIQIVDAVAPRIVLEVESGEIVAPMVKVQKDGASQGWCVWAPEGPNKEEISIGGLVNLPFTVKAAGKYKVWVRVYWPHGCANSADLVLSRKAEPEPQVLKTGNISNGNYNTWQWIAWGREPLDLGAGDYLLVVGNREDGAYVDQALFTQDLESVPQVIEKPAP